MTLRIRTLDDFYEQSKKYAGIFDAFAAKHALVGEVKADHICYKCGSAESFEHIRALFEQGSRYVFQSIISGRRIAYIRMKKGIETSLGTIEFLELSDQKPDGPQRDGFDHIEAYATAYSYDDMVKKLEAVEKVVRVERPHHTTHDIEIGEEFLFRCTRGPLIEKITKEEML
ncbi:MAG TPA: VOC family protein [Candidatus Paceibacterota bacterium]|nr:VOC family protein [Candidatus Paceibacterota bacterium]